MSVVLVCGRLNVFVDNLEFIFGRLNTNPSSIWRQKMRSEYLYFCFQSIRTITKYDEDSYCYLNML